MTKSRSSCVRNLAAAGLSGRKMNAKPLAITGSKPSRMKILFDGWLGVTSNKKLSKAYHLQPASPPTPAMFCMANARRPEKAPEREAEA